MPFQRVFSGAKWEAIVGYCRALRAGDQIFVTGTAPIADDGSVFAPGDAYRQTSRCYEIIERAIGGLLTPAESAGGSPLRFVTRVRLYVTDIARWREYGEANRQRMSEHPPCTTMVEVKALIDPAMLVEVEADAVVAVSPTSAAEAGRRD